MKGIAKNLSKIKFCFFVNFPAKHALPHHTLTSQMTDVAPPYTKRLNTPFREVDVTNQEN